MGMINCIVWTSQIVCLVGSAWFLVMVIVSELGLRKLQRCHDLFRKWNGGTITDKEMLNFLNK